MKFFTKNYFEDVTVLAVSSGNATKANMYDRNTTSQWSSVGSNDAIGESVVCQLAGFRLIDTICLRNITLAQYAISYWDAGLGAWVNVVNVVGNSDANVLHHFTAVTTQFIMLTSQFTFPPNGEKKIGEFMIYEEKVDFTDDYLPDTHEPVLYTKKHEHEKADGGSLVIIESMNPKYQNKWTWEVLPLSYVTQLETLYNAHQSIWVLPDDDLPGLQYLVNWISDFNFKKILAWTPAGERCYSGDIEVKQI